MSRYYWCVCRSFVIALVLLPANLTVQGQTRPRPVRLLDASWSSHEICMSGGGVDTSGSPAFLHLIGSSRDLPEDVCGTLGQEEWRTAAQSPVPSPEQPVAISSIADSPDGELLTLGHAGLVITAARQEVLQILSEQNRCSEWYAASQPDPAVKFASLHFRIDTEGTKTVRPHDDFSGLYLEPYVARSQQNVGAGSTITLNAYGAFFEPRAPTTASIGGSSVRAKTFYLNVANYEGGSLKAEVTTLLHEYAHIVNLLPIDAGRPESPRLSTQNTWTVLSHCRSQIEASPHRTILLPASLAVFDRQNRDN